MFVLAVGRASSAAACPPSGGRTPRSSTTACRPRTRAGKRPWAGRSRGRGCTPAFCVGCAPRRACERRAAAAGWQVTLAAAKFAWLWILDWTLVSWACECRPPEPGCLHGRANTALAVAQARASATPSSVGMSETRLADESIVEFCGLQGRADLNGKRGMVKGFVAEKDRYAVVVASGQPESRGLSSTRISDSLPNQAQRIASTQRARRRQNRTARKRPSTEHRRKASCSTCPSL